MSRPRKFPKELIDRGVRLAIESGRPVAYVAQDIGLPSDAAQGGLSAEADQGLNDAPSSAEREEIRALKRENYELRRANEFLKAASVYFATELDADRPK